MRVKCLYVLPTDFEVWTSWKSMWKNFSHFQHYQWFRQWLIEQASWTQKDESIAIFFVASWNHNSMIGFSSLGSSMTLGAWVFMVSLKRNVCTSNISPKSGSKTHELNVPSVFSI
jgi:hypothetical protein